MPSNRWNRVVYRAWAPVYDRLLQRFFAPGRATAIRMLALRPGERVLLVGVGTGQDLPLLPAGVTAVGVDLSAPMLRRAESRLIDTDAAVELAQGDAASLGLASSSFDAVVLHLVLSVVPDPAAAVAEAMRVLRQGGRAVVFDKFAPEGTHASLARGMLNLVTTAFGTAIDRRLGDLLEPAPCRVIRDAPSLLGGQYRVVLLQRTAGDAGTAGAHPPRDRPRARRVPRPPHPGGSTRASATGCVTLGLPVSAPPLPVPPCREVVREVDPDVE